MGIFDKIGDMLSDNRTKLQELQLLKEDFNKKGYNYLWQIPDSPAKKRWIELMAHFKLDVKDPVEDAKKIQEYDPELLEFNGADEECHQ